MKKSREGRSLPKERLTRLRDSLLEAYERLKKVEQELKEFEEVIKDDDGARKVD